MKTKDHLQFQYLRKVTIVQHWKVEDSITLAERQKLDKIGKVDVKTSTNFKSLFYETLPGQFNWSWERLAVARATDFPNTN